MHNCPVLDIRDDFKFKNNKGRDEPSKQVSLYIFTHGHTYLLKDGSSKQSNKVNNHVIWSLSI